MQVIHISYPVNNKFSKSCIGLGYFDGVHKGHQALLNTVLDIAHNKNILSSVLTFSTSIDKILGKDIVGEITPLEHRLSIFEEMGIDICYVLEFNKEVASLDKTIFIEDILLKLNIDSCVCGSDFRFGFKGEGDINLLKQYVDVNVCTFKLDNYLKDEKISSHNIINYIREGKIEIVKDLLGRDYSIKGKVLHGLGNGRKIGFPTANIDNNSYVLPKFGVYGVKVLIDNKEYKGLCNIGTHPTIEELSKASLEVYILDFDQDIYDKEIEIFFIKKLRDEEKFDSIEKLKNHIKTDTFSDF